MAPIVAFICAMIGHAEAGIGAVISALTRFTCEHYWVDRYVNTEHSRVHQRCLNCGSKRLILLEDSALKEGE